MVSLRFSVRRTARAACDAAAAEPSAARRRRERAPPRARRRAACRPVRRAHDRRAGRTCAASASAAVGVRDGAQLAGQPDLAEAGERRGRSASERHAARGAGDRQRDREVGAGLVDAHAADDVDEHVGACRAATPRVAGEHREHEREPVAVDAVGTRGAAARARAGATSACTSTSSGREPSIAASTTRAGRARRLADEARARRRAPRPGRSSRISKTPTSLVEPKRFFSARSVR